MSSHSREPINHTCPDIDRIIKYIKLAMVNDRELKNMSPDELFDTASEMNQQLYECIDFLEDMRKSNDTLRKWGVEEAKEVDRLENELLELNDKQ